MPPSSPLQAAPLQPSPFQSAAEAVRSFVAEVSPDACRRLEVKVSSREGMPLLCAVESVLAQAFARPAAQELIWLGGAPALGGHVLRLQAFGPDNALLAEAVYEFAA